MKYLTLVVLLAGCDASGDTPMRLILPGMAMPVPFEAYGTHPHLGSVLQAPPEGTVPMGTMPYPYARDDKVRPGLELHNPLASSGTAELPRAKRIYETYCMVCHGPAGEGDGPIIGRFPNPPSFLAQPARALPDGQIFHIITQGRGLMASYAAQVRPEDRWRLVLYIRWLQRTGGGA
jgi:mono/diheme cytochrome c family protein